jgi:deazaflavin-dependent oxidoreductase (nitroreductase family)
MWVTNGRYSAAKLLFGMPVVCLTTTGARSGQPRTVPLLAIPDDENIILIASNWGQGHHPGWYYNLRANPEVHVEYNGFISPYFAQQAAGEERERKWRTAVDFYPGYEAYKKWAKGREIPVFVLSPIEKR